MKEIYLEKEKLKDFIIKLEYLKHGGNGIIYKLTDDELVKLFYHNYFKDYDISIINKTIEDIVIKVDNEHTRKILFPNYITQTTKLKQLITRLDNTSSNDLYKGIIKIDDTIIGTILNYYKDYSSYQDIHSKLSPRHNIYLLNKLRHLVEELLNNGIYPTDLKLDNIMINKDTLDVKLIDLDDNTTVLTDIKEDCYRYEVARRFAHIRKKIING